MCAPLCAMRLVEKKDNSNEKDNIGSTGILHNLCGGRRAGIPAAIYWDEQYLEYYIMSGSGDSDRLTLADAKYEIIGNIHDNPDILSTDKNS